jgi:ribosomal protein S12 methylthiotransferase
MRVTPRHFAYLKISEGCDRLCTFCAIPKMRGKHATKPIENVIAEARELAADGVKELVVVAQDTTYYGIDMYREPRLVELLTELDKVDGIEWIRLMYLYPMYFGDDLIDTIAASPKIVPYLDMPLQHASDRMLKRMQRRVNKTDTVALVNKLRSRIDNLVLRTTMLVGFPGETEDDFSELVDFVGEHQFQRLGVFSYSLEPDTPAARLPDHLPEEVKEQRRETLMAAQQDIAFDWADSMVGQQLKVLIDRPLPEQEGVWIARTYADAPDVDCIVYVTGEGLRPGEFVDVEVVARSDYDLAAAAL